MLTAEKHTLLTLQIKHIDDFLRKLGGIKYELEKERKILLTKLGEQYFYDLRLVEDGGKIIISKFAEQNRIPFDLRYDETENKLFFSGDIFYEKKERYGKDSIEYIRRKMATVKRGNRKVQKIAYNSWCIDVYSAEDAQEIKSTIKEIINSFMER